MESNNIRLSRGNVRFFIRSSWLLALVYGSCEAFISPNLELGLVLHLDAANLQSYPGSGTTWFDLSTSKNNLYWTNNSPPTFAMHLGHRVLRTTPLANSETVAFSKTFKNLRAGSSSYSAVAVYKPNSLSSWKVLLSIGPMTSCSSAIIHPISINMFGVFSGGACGGLGSWDSSEGIQPSALSYIIQITTYDGLTERVYINGNLDKMASMTSSTPISSSNAK